MRKIINMNGKGYVYMLYHSLFMMTIVKIGSCISRLPSDRCKEYNKKYGTSFNAYRYWVVPPTAEDTTKYERIMQAKFVKFDRRKLYLAEVEEVAAAGDALFESQFPELNRGISKRPIFVPKSRLSAH